MKTILQEKSYAFAIRVVKLSQYLNTKKKEFVLSKQILRSGTGIGAIICEAKFGQSRADFLHKMSMSLKEANETLFWLDLLKDTDYIDQKLFESLHADCNEITSLLVATVKTTKQGGKN